MWILILQIFFTALVYYIVIYNLSRFRFKKSHLCLLITISTVICVAIDMYNPQYALLENLIFVCIASVFLIFALKEISFSICIAISGMIILLISMSVATFITSALLRVDPAVIGSNAFLYGTVLLLIFVLSFIVSKLVGKVFQKGRLMLSAIFRKKYVPFLAVGLLLALVFFYINFFLFPLSPHVRHNPVLVMAVNVSTNIFYLIILVSSAYIFLVSIRNHVENIHKQELLDIQRDYIANLEKLYGGMREFRHNYINIVVAMYGFLEDKNYEGLNDYFTNQIVPIKNRMKNTNSTIDRLKDILLPEIKGILLLKLMQAQDSGIQVDIAVVGTIDSIDFDTVSVTKIVGILLDNALEACHGSADPYIKFAIEKKENEIIMFIVNPASPALPPIAAMFKKDFSTKGIGRGLGLYTVRQIIDSSENAVLNTYIKNDEFIQEVIFVNHGIKE